MNEEELRALVREAIARHRAGAVAPARPTAPATVRVDISHHRFLLPAGDVDGPCLIEPAVRCVHCGFCQSYGH